ncbi:LOW QUALITY PROTEIN: granulin a [Cottoperca gobio]|uniref:LOW QUALITY PROTEIN: granulin a n=1 Tax=Cottoperca gobio TaxID=56716 RepID=A0A6J2Q551_COTGO|nr:LOW QUALITY PROTEIN: progranulin-like [Cottoperca gobio]
MLRSSPYAVCCTDGDHCCPKGTTCNEDEATCVKEDLVIPWYTKHPATNSIEASSSTHCDELNQCPEHTTCCRLLTGEWGCCPMENAVCCQNKEHCCPQGYTCNIASMSCQKLILLELENVPLTPVDLLGHQSLIFPSNLRNVPCDEQVSCLDGQTCCRVSSTTWGCCNSPNAVCCSDMQHCCPTGYTCNDVGDCSKNTVLHWQDWHVFQANKKRALLV